MSATTAHETAAQSPAAEPTLGGLLYADPSKPRVPEAEWVALVHGVAGQDPRALRALYERCHRLVFTLALRLTGDGQTAEELTVDTFHEAWTRAPDYDAANGTVLGWIMNLARSRTIDRLRHDGRQKRTAPAHARLAEPVAEPRDEAQQLEAAQLLKSALALLTPPEREAIELAYFDDMSYSETARALQQPLGTVKTRIRSGLAKLREALGGQGLPERAR